MAQTLAEAKQWLRDRVDDGAECPCCEQFAKVYKRKLNSTMARGLLWLYKQGDGWVEANRTAPHWLVSKGGTFATLSHWGLIEEQPGTGGAKRTSGVWRITPAGKVFASGAGMTPARVRLYAGRVLGFSSEQTTIREALGKRFNYDELMQL